MCKRILFLLCFLPIQLVMSQSVLTNFPQGYTPEEVGNRLAYRFMEKYKMSDRKGIGYSDTFNWSGALKYAAVAKDERLLKLLQNKFDSLFTIKKQILPKKTHVDWNMFGSLALEFYRVTKEKRYLELGLSYADTQWELPENAKAKEREWDANGYSWQTRLWIDDMYMITIVQTQAYRMTGDRKYIERAAKEMVLYLDELQRPNGLF